MPIILIIIVIIGIVDSKTSEIKGKTIKIIILETISNNYY